MLAQLSGCLASLSDDRASSQQIIDPPCAKGNGVKMALHGEPARARRLDPFHSRTPLCASRGRWTIDRLNKRRAPDAYRSCNGYCGERGDNATLIHSTDRLKVIGYPLRALDSVKIKGGGRVA